MRAVKNMEHNAQVDTSTEGVRDLAVCERDTDTRGAVAVAQRVSDGAAIIDMIERAARDPSVDLDKMERLFAMKERMDASRAKQEFLAAFSELQRELPAVAKRGKGHNDKTYARFEDVIDTAKPHLADHGFSLSFRLEHSEKTIKITGVLGHASGHSESTDIVLPADASGSKNAVQAWGSSVSYGKRYVALTLLGIATEDDDDGKKADQSNSAPVTEQDVADFRKALKSKNVPEGAVCELFSVENLEDLTRKQFDDAVKKLAMTKVRK